jgi:hypothetical protein
MINQPTHILKSFWSLKHRPLLWVHRQKLFLQRSFHFVVQQQKISMRMLLKRWDSIVHKIKSIIALSLKSVKCVRCRRCWQIDVTFLYILLPRFCIILNRFKQKYCGVYVKRMKWILSNKNSTWTRNFHFFFMRKLLRSTLQVQMTSIISFLCAENLQKNLMWRHLIVS